MRKKSGKSPVQKNNRKKGIPPARECSTFKDPVMEERMLLADPPISTFSSGKKSRGGVSQKS